LLPNQKKGRKNERKKGRTNISSSTLNYRFYMEGCIVSWMGVKLQYAVDVDCCFFVGL